MGIKSKIKSICKRITGIWQPAKPPIPEPPAKPPVKPLEILLLTNRDSDNVGDQVIEACDIALIETVMKNLNIPVEEFKINSRAAALISKKYLETRNPKLIESAEKAIQKSDIVIFGGAPLFNYLYQEFYERTAVTLELAQKHNKPVVFSAIGVEQYNANNAKCQRLKKALNFDCVKQITTRDGYPLLQQYKANDQLVIGKVSDPAVFASKVFEKYTAKKQQEKKKVGIFVLRANGFVDNKVNFPKEEAAALWKGIVHELKSRGYDYEILTSGHFGDEAFMDTLIRRYDMDSKKCAFNINSPEALTRKISSYDAVISCRLHPSIISFSFDVPSVGIVWNSKVKKFYESIGYEDRVIEVADITPEKVVEKVEQIMAEGITKDEEYLASVYHYLFNGIKNVLRPDETDAVPYTYAELMQNIPPFKGTSQKEQALKLTRKFRRTYDKYNALFDSNRENKEIIKELQAEIAALKSQKTTD